MKKETGAELPKAINAVMKAVKGIDKSMTVGSGKFSYKGIADKDVKKTIGDAMEKNGLSIIPIEVIPTIKIDRWSETTNYGEKQKQSVFTEVTVKYLLMHTSGESCQVVGYGHGVDAMDKGAGKAMTYALKTLLLYMFLVPTGSIDDTDKTHSNDSAPAPAKKETKVPFKAALNDTQFKKAVKAIENGDYKCSELREQFALNTVQDAAVKLIESKLV